MTRAAPSEFHDLAVGEHDREPADNVFDLPVAVRVLAGSATRDPSAHRGQIEGLREVPHRPTALLDERLEFGTERSRLDLDGARDGVNRLDSIKPGQVERDGAGGSDRATPDTRASSLRGHRDPLLARKLEDGADLIRRARTHDHAGPVGHAAARHVGDREGPPVAPVRGATGHRDVVRHAESVELGQQSARGGIRNFAAE